MKRPERLKLIEKIRARIKWTRRNIYPSPDYPLLRQAATCIEQLEKELDAIHENFIRESE